MTLSTLGDKKTKKKNCRYCRKPAHAFLDDGNTGRGSIIETARGSNPWELKGETVTLEWMGKTKRKKYKKTTIQPHHLIPISLMFQDTNWKRKPSDTKVGLRNPTYGEVLHQFGYNINCPENGAFYPDRPELACHLEVPLHNGPHPQDTLDYAISRVKPIMEELRTGKYCDNYDLLKKDLKLVSKKICDAINSFSFSYATVTTSPLDNREVNVMLKTKTKVESKAQFKIKDSKPRKVIVALTDPEDGRDFSPGKRKAGCGNAERNNGNLYCEDGRTHFPGLKMVKGKALPEGKVG